jgi:putative ABC transport system permease protein
MYKIYFKQTLRMLKQNSFISIISIAGTALAIMMIMTLIVSDEVKTLSIAPENNRYRTLYLTYQVKRDTVMNSTMAGNLSPDIVSDYLLHLKTPQYVSAMNAYWPGNKTVVNVEGSPEYSGFVLRAVDERFWKLFAFDFTGGVPFTEEEFKSGIHNAVLSESTARSLFRGEKALGRTIQIGFRDFRVTGIVRDVSPVFKWAAGDIWAPYTSLGNGEAPGAVLLAAGSVKDFPAISAEVREVERKFGIDRASRTLYLKGPQNQQTSVMNIKGMTMNEDELRESIRTAKRRKAFIFLVLLIVPALNLSGFSLSQIRKRTAEIGIRKAFGARKHVILIQVLYENMMTSLAGGIIGLALSWAVVVRLKDWLLDVPPGSGVPVGALLSPVVFGLVLLACLALNLLSAGLSAWNASRMTIVNSLNQNIR